MNVRSISTLAVALSAACRPSGPEPLRIERAELDRREARLVQALSVGDSTSAPAAADSAALARWILSGNLAEISGLTLTDDGRLLAHNDEMGRVSEIDYRRGVVIKQFVLGNGVTGDFEAIATAYGTVFLLTSKGKIYEFREAGNGGRVDYTVQDTRLSDECEFEAMAYEPQREALLLVCKEPSKKELDNSLVMYRWKLRGGAGPRVSQVIVPLGEIIEANDWKGFRPSDVAIDPNTGNYIVVASREKALISVTPDARIVWVRPLTSKHEMAEGIAITKDSILIISDEVTKDPAAITLYRWR